MYLPHLLPHGRMGMRRLVEVSVVVVVVVFLDGYEAAS